jgi:hypothetical protein
MNDKLGQKLNSYALGLAVVCLLALALASVFGLATTAVKTVLMVGITVSGTVAWVVHAQQKCRHCDAPNGFRIRLVNSHLCAKCGGELRDE